MLEVPGSFRSLLNGQFEGFLDGLNPNGSAGPTIDLGGFGESTPGSGPGRIGDLGLELQSTSNAVAESFLGFQMGGGDSSCWGGNIGGGGGGGGGGGSGNGNGNGNGWPDLAIYTPGSTYQ